MLLQDVDHEPVGVDGDRQEARLEHRERLDGPDVARLVDADDVTWIQEHLGHQVEGLLRPVGDEHLLGLDRPVPPGCRLASHPRP